MPATDKFPKRIVCLTEETAGTPYLLVKQGLNFAIFAAWESKP